MTCPRPDTGTDVALRGLTVSISKPSSTPPVVVPWLSRFRAPQWPRDVDTRGPR